MAGVRYVPSFRELIKDPYVVEELDTISSTLQGLYDTLIREIEGTGSAEDELEAGGTSEPGGIRWTKGPWLLNQDGAAKGGAVLRPPAITANQDLYAPSGLDEAVVLEVSSDAARSITALKAKTRHHRLLLLTNIGSFDMTLVHTSPSADPGLRYTFEFPDAANFVLEAKQMILLYQDPAEETWRPASYSQPPGGGVTTYDVTIANADASVAEGDTTVATFTVPANSWLSGEVVYVRFPLVLIKNSSGAGRTTLLKVAVGGTTNTVFTIS